MKPYALAFVVLLGAAPAMAADVPAYVGAAIADPSRPKDDRDSDALREPALTLAFAGVKPGMIVGELYPCGGYFSRMLSDIVGPKGRVYGTDTIRWNGCAEATAKAVGDRANYTLVSEPFGVFKLPEKVDLFWITQNYHDLHIKAYGDVDMARFNQAVFDSLKRGGSYFIVDHDANPGMSAADIARLHRIEKAQVVREVTATGFRLADETRLPGRAGDDHTRTIFDPAIRGHTDQYLLRFVKP